MGDLSTDENDMVLESMNSASVGFLNGTNEQFDLKGPSLASWDNAELN